MILVPYCVKQEHAAFFKVAYHIVARYVRLIVASHEIRLIDKIRRLNRRFSEPKVRNRYAARLFGVVLEIALRVHIRVVADYLYAVFVRAYRAVAAESVELATLRSFGRCVYKLFRSKRRARYVVVYADRKVVFGFGLIKIVVNCVYVRGREFFRAQAVSSAYYFYVGSSVFQKRGTNV